MELECPIHLRNITQDNKLALYTEADMYDLILIKFFYKEWSKLLKLELPKIKC